MTSSIIVTCTRCQKRLKLGAGYAGKKIRCPACESVFQIPPADAAPADAAPEQPQRRRPTATVEPPQRRERQQPVKKQPTPPLDDVVDDDMWEDEDFDDDFDEDPYAPPASRSRTSKGSGRGGGGFTVEGNLIRCGPSVSLPKFCVKTGHSKELVVVKKTLKYSPVWSWLVGGVILALIMQKSCDVRYYMSPAAKKNAMLMMIGGILVFLIGIGLMVGGAIAATEILMLPGLIFAVAGLIASVNGSSPIKIAKHENQVFWLKGCKDSFFDRLPGS